MSHPKIMPGQVWRMEPGLYYRVLRPTNPPRGLVGEHWAVELLGSETRKQTKVARAFRTILAMKPPADEFSAEYLLSVGVLRS